jgi:hypothetical protein
MTEDKYYVNQEYEARILHTVNLQLDIEPSWLQESSWGYGVLPKHAML